MSDLSNLPNVQPVRSVFADEKYYSLDWMAELEAELVSAEKFAARRGSDAVAQRQSSIQLGDPWLILVNAAGHVADALIDETGTVCEGRQDAWWELKERADCFLHVKSGECANCGEMEGLHQLETYCRDQRDRGEFSNHLISYRFEARQSSEEANLD